MALVNIDNVLRDTLRILKKAELQAGVLLMSYKRNRSIALLKISDNSFELREDGYEKQSLEIMEDDLVKELRRMIKREFPRSRKVRLVKISHPEELEYEHKKL